MNEPASILGPWSNFYVIAGSSAAALTGLMFVVITLVNDVNRIRRNPDGIGTFSTPTVVHFCAALYTSALLSMPWGPMHVLAVLLGLPGAAGIVYVGCLAYKARRLSTYTPDMEDWTWYTALPTIAYAGIAASATLLFADPRGALFGFAG